MPEIELVFRQMFNPVGNIIFKATARRRQTSILLFEKLSIRRKFRQDLVHQISARLFVQLHVTERRRDIIVESFIL
ncbi:hypothetical protein WS70_08715 [Burkholderia mayonis]|uniref:Uncharacterized protein n=1 Tax=Burkholderia mayonis TaxID=1385591 RepID=A0A1B4FE10_9BURK|nr:hypothetical protein WS70_08715 [Burkholderia mayonis]KVE46041.1 hypothetical protein WS70_03115 [Burkholderia mayonis]